jgi:CheY-like chemotaxis protein
MVDDSSPLLLVVEDNEFSRKLIATALNGRRYLFAKNGKEAIGFFEVNKPDMVFLDIELPDLTGLTVLSELLKVDPAAFIVMLSANSDKETVVKCIKSGAKGFIAKPFSKAKVDSYIEKYHSEKKTKSN